MSENDWSEQAAGMMGSWMDAQRAMWQAWMDWAANSSNKETPSFADIADEWQKLAMQSVEAWGAAADPIAQSTAEQFIAAQGVALRFLNFSAQAWETVTPKIKSGEDWQKAMEDVMEEFRQRWVNLPADAEAMSQDVEAMWKLYMDQWRAFGQPWETVWTRGPGLWGRAVTGDSAALFELADAYHTAYRQTLGRLATSPNLGLTREFNARLLEGFDAFTALNVAGAEYQAVVAETWDAAFKQFAEDLAGLAERGEKIDNVRDLITMWTRGAENIFLDAFRTERYTLAQGKFLNANMEYRISQRRIVEKYLEAFDIPTRSEVDEAHRRIYELRKEVKALKKQIKGMQVPAESEAKAKPAPRKRKSTSRKKKEA
jgi:class III poly(R)-hydroxyalkanoic acid synthase PhaE subunit